MERNRGKPVILGANNLQVFANKKEPRAANAGFFLSGTISDFANLDFERQPTFASTESPVATPAGFSLSKEMVMNEGFPLHIVGFMRRKREKEQDKRDEQPSPS